MVFLWLRFGLGAGGLVVDVLVALNGNSSSREQRRALNLGSVVVSYRTVPLSWRCLLLIADELGE